MSCAWCGAGPRAVDAPRCDECGAALRPSDPEMVLPGVTEVAARPTAWRRRGLRPRTRVEAPADEPDPIALAAAIGTTAIAMLDGDLPAATGLALEVAQELDPEAFAGELTRDQLRELAANERFADLDRSSWAPPTDEVRAMMRELEAEARRGSTEHAVPERPEGEAA